MSHATFVRSLLAIQSIVMFFGLGCQQKQALGQENSQEESRPFSTTGTIVGLSRGSIQMKADNGDLWLVYVEAGETKVAVNGTIGANLLKSGTGVRFQATLDAGGEIQGEIDQIELFTTRTSRSFGVFPANADADAARINKPIAGTYEIRGRVTRNKDGELALKAGSIRLKGKLAAGAVISVNTDDISYAQAGDAISVQGIFYDRTAPDAAAQRPGRALASSVTITMARRQPSGRSQGDADSQGEKTVYIPEAFRTEPALKEWSWDRSFQSENFVVFWGPEVTGAPTEIPDAGTRFDPKAITEILEPIYNKYITNIGFCSDEAGTNLARYKLIIVMNDTWDEGGPSGFAFGASYDNTIGAMWVHPGATRDGGVLSHELTHSLQGMISIQENATGGGYVGWESAGFFWECHANFMRCQMYPKFAGDELPRWIGTSMFHWSSTRHHY